MADQGKVSIVGIDLGTTNSEIYKIEHGNPVPCVGPNKITVTPSRVVVHPGSEGDQVRYATGAQARNLAKRAPQNEIYEPKRIIGRKYNDDYVKRDIHYWPFTIVEGKDDLPYYRVDGKDRTYDLSAVDVDAQILRTMKNYVKEGVDKAVITVPSYFTKSQMDATKLAGEQAGFEVRKIIPEPVAAAIAYGRKYDVKNHIILVYDLGGGTFDCCLVKVTNNQYQVLAKDGHSHLGGADFDNAIVRFVCQQYKDRYKYDLYERKSDLNALKTEAEKTKIALSDPNNPTYTLKFTPHNVKGDTEELPVYSHDFTRAEFEGLIQREVNTTINYIRRILEQMNLDKGNIDDVVCVGGSTRIPLVRESIRAFFENKPIDFNAVNIDEAVAEGAAIYADSLESGIELLQGNDDTPPEDDPFPQPDPIEEIPYHIYFNPGDGYRLMFKKNQRFPVDTGRIRANRNFRPLFDYMKYINVDLFSSEDDGKTKVFMGRCRLEIPEPYPRDLENGIIRISLIYLNRGKLTCILTDAISNVSQSFECVCRGDDLDNVPEREAARLLYSYEKQARTMLRKTYGKGNSDEVAEKRKQIMEFMTYLDEFGINEDVEDLKENFEMYLGPYM